MATQNLLIQCLLLSMNFFVSCQNNVQNKTNSVTTDLVTNSRVSEDHAFLNTTSGENRAELITNESCMMNVSNRSVKYFRSRLEKNEPYLMHLVFVIQDENNRTIEPNKTEDSFRPDRWVWTYSTPRGVYPYLNWNTDYNVLSFNLLSAKTLHGTTTLYFHTESDCPITYGTRNTTIALARGLLYMMPSLKLDPKYENSYFCFLAEAPGVRNTWQYTVSIYTAFPINYINYNCCVTYYDYTSDEFRFTCSNQQNGKWLQNTSVPYIIGLFLFLYFPITMLHYAAWASREDPVDRTMCEHSRHLLINASCVQEDNDVNDDDEWTYLGSVPPIGLIGLLTSACGIIKENHKTCWSRFRRAISLILSPAAIYVQLLLYIHFEDLDELIDHGTPVGFLSLLGKDRQKSRQVFVPCLGGATGLLAIYYILGFFIIVVPPSLKDLSENGFYRTEEPKINSPLFFSSYKILQLSLLPIRSQPGYENCALLCKCSIYMVFSKAFWKTTLALQVQRFANLASQSKLRYLIRAFLLPFYIAICIIESCLCIVFYLIPLFTFLSILHRGISRYMKTFYTVTKRSRACPILLDALFYSSLLLAVSMTVAFSFTAAMVFVASFVFIMQVVMFCFVAVIIFPSVAFGYLFFFVAVFYYMVRLVHGFADTYTELLQEAIDVSRGISDLNKVSTFDGRLHISNVRMRPMRQVIINNVVVAVTDTQLQSITNGVPANEQKVRLKEHMYGIPTDLFHFLVKRHRPVHQQVLRIAFQLMLILMLVVMALSITTTFATTASSEISDVMHVIFIVSVGALPRILEVAFKTAEETVKRDIEVRKLEQSIVEFWQMKERQTFVTENEVYRL